MKTTQKQHQIGVQIGLAVYGLALAASLLLAGCHQTAACYQYSASDERTCSDCTDKPPRTQRLHRGELALTQT